MILSTASLQGGSVIPCVGCMAVMDVDGIPGPNAIGRVIQDIDRFRPGPSLPVMSAC